MLISTLNQVQQKQSYPRFLVFISLLLFVCDTQASTSDFFTFNEATKLNSNFKELTSAFKYPHWSNPDNKILRLIGNNLAGPSRNSLNEIILYLNCYFVLKLRSQNGRVPFYLRPRES